ncbi:hypothetical protein PoB_006712900 [Plakobranchus ocellatus]|uniref:Uncharacterized protein n=1 Tax=Plakobranchus ocellatus TaxID=259542 RepID=A0AAV4D8W7_9GAST|nr:hypothetical protein PoB_006712900 [Plakobranchus ocellatus]
MPDRLYRVFLAAANLTPESVGVRVILASENDYIIQSSLVKGVILLLLLYSFPLASNGADYCGLMYVQSILLDRLDVDRCLSVPLVVGAIKAIRPQVIPTLTHYKCLYEVLKLVHNACNVYGNIGSIRATTKESKHESSDSIASSNHSESKKEKPEWKRGEYLKESNRPSRKKAESKPSPVLSPKPDQAETTAGNKDKADGSDGGTGDSSFDDSARVEYVIMQSLNT